MKSATSFITILELEDEVRLDLDSIPAILSDAGVIAAQFCHYTRVGDRYKVSPTSLRVY